MNAKQAELPKIDESQVEHQDINKKKQDQVQVRSESENQLITFADGENFINFASIQCLLKRSYSVDVFDMQRVKQLDIKCVDEI